MERGLWLQDDVPTLRPHETRQPVQGPQWYAARVQPQRELSVVGRLERFAAYSPCFVLDGKPWGPVFRSYVFCEFDMDGDDWALINDDRHVVKLLPLHRAYPVPLDRAMIENCRKRDAAGEFLIHSRLALKYRPGDWVPIHYGGFQGMRGKFVKQQGSVAHLMMSIFSALREISIPVSHLMEPA